MKLPLAKNHVWLVIYLVIILVTSIIGYGMHSYHTHKNKDPEWFLAIARASINWKKNTPSLAVAMSLPSSRLDPNINTVFTRNDEPVMYVENHQGGNTWGRGMLPIGGDSEGAPLPDRMHLVFMDDFNNYQVYQLDVDLPLAQMKELLTTVHRGTTDLSQRENGRIPNVYTGFELGFAPDGWVIFYATGIGLQKELGSWQAKKIEVSDAILNEITVGDGVQVRRGEAVNLEREGVKRDFPDIYQGLITGKIKFTSDWYKQMQTKYPWNLEVTSDGSQWLGEYTMDFANTERSSILSDQLEADKKALKPVPTTIGTWLVETATKRKYYVEIHSFPRPKWTADMYMPYYQDPNLTYFAKRFQHFYPNRSLETNNQLAKPEEFATLKIHLNEDGKMDDIYLQKGAEKLPIDGAYEYYLAEVDPKQGGYIPESEGYDYFVTKPKIKDLSDPLFVDLD